MNVLVVAVTVGLVLAGCASSSSAPAWADAAPTVESAFDAFIDAANARDLSAIEGFLAPPGDSYAIGEIMDAAREFEQSLSPDSHLDIVSFVVTGTDRDEARGVTVVSYEASFDITEPDTTSLVQVRQDVSLEWLGDQWLIIGADPAVTTQSAPVMGGSDG